VVENAEGNIAASRSRAGPEWPDTAVPPGSESRACTGGFSRNLGGLVVSVRKGGTAERRKRSDAGWAARNRSTSIGPEKWGNRPEGPHGGKRGAVLRARARPHGRDTELTNHVSARSDSVAEQWAVGLVWGDVHASYRGEFAARRAGCGSPACPDLWGPRGAIPGATRPVIFGSECFHRGSFPREL
jgi:hypothetical protein